ncbi:MAG: hypothetical protein KAH32_04875 [Chlamydiia bacterium]|nr:hypothetical protein [Chlamydiia bacterium]
MRIYISTEVAEKVGFNQAILLEHIFSVSPQHKLKLEQSVLSKLLPISLSSVQRGLRSLLDSGYLLKHDRAEYSLTVKFYSEFKDYTNYEKYFQ